MTLSGGVRIFGYAKILWAEQKQTLTGERVIQVRALTSDFGLEVLLWGYLPTGKFEASETCVACILLDLRQRQSFTFSDNVFFGRSSRRSDQQYNG